MTAAEMPAGPGPVEPPWWRVSSAVLVTVVAAAWLVLSEIDRLVEGVVGGGENQSVAATVGVGAWGARDRAWDIWGSDPDAVRGLLVAHTLVDVLFFLSLGLLLIRWAVATAPRWVAGAFVALEGVEAFLLLVSFGLLDASGVPAGVTWPLAIVASFKWLALVLFVLLQVADQEVRARVGAGLLRLRRALFFQRLSLVVLLVIAVLSLVPLSDIWDQLPDVQRQWVDDKTGTQHLLAALLSVAAVTGGLWVLGRQRAERAFSAYASQEDRKPAEYRWWLVGPVAAAVGAGLLSRLGDDLIDWKTLGVFVCLPLALVGASAGLRRWKRLDCDYRPDLDPARAEDVRTAGDALALLLPWVMGLALVRSFTAPVFVPASAQAAMTDRWARQAVLWLVGLTAALVLSERIRRAAAATRPRTPAPGVPDAKAFGDVRLGGRATALKRRVGSTVTRLLDPTVPTQVGRWPVVAWIASIAALLAFLLSPFAITKALGVVSTMLLLIGGWVLFVGFLMVHLQTRQPLRIFKVFNLRANPLLTLLVALPLLANATNPGGDLHAIRGEVSVAPQRAPLEKLVATWYAASGDCDRKVEGLSVRPMLLVAASGGGIRAAYWTATVLDAVRMAGTCGPRAVLLSSGVSGGSVGLALSRTGSGVEGVEALADPDALSAAISGLMVGDMIGGMTGLRIPAFGEGETEWLDRAGLMERVWERQAPSLAEPFDQPGQRLKEGSSEGPEQPTGALLLNSALAGVGCRVLVGQVDLGSADGGPGSAAAPSPGPDPGRHDAGGRCTARNDRPAASLDLRDLYPPGCQQPALRLSTAAMLSARFPTVTPGGRLTGTAKDCEPRPDAPLVDGGYAEASGVGTLADLAPALAEVVREHNAETGKSLIVPIVVYLEDAARSDLAPAPVRAVPEAFVPLTGLSAGAAQVASGAWLQRTAAALSRSCPEVASPCDTASDALRDRLTGGVVVVAPRTKPGVDAPLGWTLSKDSRTRLTEAVQDQLAPCHNRSAGGYTCLADLVRVLREGKKQF